MFHLHKVGNYTVKNHEQLIAPKCKQACYQLRKLYFFLITMENMRFSKNCSQTKVIMQVLNNVINILPNFLYVYQ